MSSAHHQGVEVPEQVAVARCSSPWVAAHAVLLSPHASVCAPASAALSPVGELHRSCADALAAGVSRAVTVGATSCELSCLAISTATFGLSGAAMYVAALSSFSCASGAVAARTVLAWLIARA